MEQKQNIILEIEHLIEKLANHQQGNLDEESTVLHIKELAGKLFEKASILEFLKRTEMFLEVSSKEIPPPNIEEQV